MDLSHMIPYLQLPDIDDITIRGELIMPIELFNKKYKVQGHKSARNFVGGIMNSKTKTIGKWRDLNMVAYEVIKPELKPSAQMTWLEQNNVVTVKHALANQITNESLSSLLVDWRDSYAYEIDGIIVVNDKIYPRANANPKHAFAFKMVLSDQVAEVKIVDVIYTASKYGYLKPVIQIEPVHIRGADIEFATAHNIKNVIDNNIGIGAIVQLVRSGDVIPKIEKIIVPADEPKLPDVPWKWNDTKVDALLINYEASDVVRDKNIVAFFKVLNVLGFGEGNVARVVSAGFISIPQILRMEITDFLDIPGFKEKMAIKIYTSIKDRIEIVSLPTLMKATNIFGRGMGETRISAILKAYPKILTQKGSLDEKEDMIKNIEGFAGKTAHLFARHIQDFLDFIEETGLQKKLRHSVTPIAIQAGPLNDKKILLTGFRDASLETRIKEHGGKVVTSVSSKVFIVLVPSLDANTGKAKTAREKGITLMTAQTFTEKYL